MRSRSGRADALSRVSALVRRAGLVAGFVTVSAACSGRDDAVREQQPADVGPAPACEGRGETIERGMSKTSDDGLLTVSLAKVTPLPPVQGENSWTVHVSENGEPVVDEGDADAQVIANIYMAEHDHNIRKRGAMTSPGVFEFVQFPITMNGYWEITIQVQSDSDANERNDALFGFCVSN
jgi:hypothetical protein